MTDTDLAKATAFLDRWKKFQEDREQKRKPMTDFALQNSNNIKKETNRKPEKKVVSSRYLNHATNSRPSLEVKKSVASSRPSIAKKRESVEPKKAGTPMSVKLERWKKFKEDRKENLTSSKKKKSAQNAHTMVKSNTEKDNAHFKKQENERIEKQNKNLSKEKSTFLSSQKEAAPKTTKNFTSIKGTISQNKKDQQSTSHRKPLTNIEMPSPLKYKSSHFQYKNAKSKEETLKRRHSALDTASLKSTRSILKRKSCLPSLTDISEVLDKTPSRNVRFLSPDTKHSHNQKFRKTPLKLSNRSMRHELADWLQAKGKTPSGFRHLQCFDACLSAKKKNFILSSHKQQNQKTSPKEKTADKDTLAVNLDVLFENADESVSNPSEDLPCMLEECSTLYEAGCPLEDILKWMDSIEENVSCAKTSASFYISKANILKSTNDLQQVLKVFETAVKKGAQPAEELACSLTKIVTEISEEREQRARLQSALNKEREEGNVCDSKSIKYCVRQLTPHKSRKRISDGGVDVIPCKVVTPVRRSTRLSISNLPEQFHDQVPVYDKLEDLPTPEKKNTYFQPNPALKDLDDVFLL